MTSPAPSPSSVTHIEPSKQTRAPDGRPRVSLLRPLRAVAVAVVVTCGACARDRTPLPPLVADAVTVWCTGQSVRITAPVAVARLLAWANAHGERGVPAEASPVETEGREPIGLWFEQAGTPSGRLVAMPQVFWRWQGGAWYAESFASAPRGSQGDPVLPTARQDVAEILGRQAPPFCTRPRPIDALR